MPGVRAAVRQEGQLRVARGDAQRGQAVRVPAVRQEVQDEVAAEQARDRARREQGDHVRRVREEVPDQQRVQGSLQDAHRFVCVCAEVCFLYRLVLIFSSVLFKRCRSFSKLSETDSYLFAVE